MMHQEMAIMEQLLLGQLFLNPQPVLVPMARQPLHGSMVKQERLIRV